MSARSWALLAARHPARLERCLSCGAEDCHLIRGPLVVEDVDVFAGVTLRAARCRLCSTGELAVAGRAWLQFKSRKEMAIGAAR